MRAQSSSHIRERAAIAAKMIRTKKYDRPRNISGVLSGALNVLSFHSSTHSTFLNLCHVSGGKHSVKDQSKSHLLHPQSTTPQRHSTLNYLTKMPRPRLKSLHTHDGDPQGQLVWRGPPYKNGEDKDISKNKKKIMWSRKTGDAIRRFWRYQVPGKICRLVFMQNCWCCGSKTETVNDNVMLIWGWVD